MNIPAAPDEKSLAIANAADRIRGNAVETGSCQQKEEE